MSESPQYVISSYCVGGECVAVAADESGVRVRSTTSGTTVAFSADEWTAFLAGVRNGEFDLGRLRH